MMVMAAIKVIYDSDCPLCRASVAKIEQLDTLGLVRAVPITEHNLPERLPSRAELEREMHIMMPDGSIYNGADAVAKLASLFPKTRWLGFVISLPLIRSIARLVYRIIAANRMKLFGKSS